MVCYTTHYLRERKSSETDKYIKERNWIFEEIGEMLKIIKNINNVIREKIDIKNSVLE